MNAFIEYVAIVMMNFFSGEDFQRKDVSAAPKFISLGHTTRVFGRKQ